MYCKAWSFIFQEQLKKPQNPTKPTTDYHILPQIATVTWDTTGKLHVRAASARRVQTQWFHSQFSWKTRSTSSSTPQMCACCLPSAFEIPHFVTKVNFHSKGQQINSEISHFTMMTNCCFSLRKVNGIYPCWLQTWEHHWHRRIKLGLTIPCAVQRTAGRYY